MSTSFYIRDDETAGASPQMLDRLQQDDIAVTRRLEGFETSMRHRKMERKEAKERLSIDLTPLVEHEDYAILAAKHLRIGTRRAELDQELGATKTSLAKGMAAFNKHRVEHQAQAIIDGVEIEIGQGFEEMRSRSVRLENEARSHSHALGQIRAEMEAIKSERSIDAAETARPAHTQVVAVIADACSTLLKALRDEALIREIVTEAGYDNRLPIFQGIKELSELESRARDYAR